MIFFCDTNRANNISTMKQMFKGIAEGMLGMSCAIMCAPMLVKLMVTANDLINPMESIFKRKVVSNIDAKNV